MNGLAVFAFVIMPMIVVAMGYVAVLLHEAASRRLDEAEARRAKPQPITSSQARD